MEWSEARSFVSETAEFDPPSLFAKVLCETMPVERGATRMIDVGCGTGIIGIFSLVEKKAQSVTFVDVLPEAIATARANVSQHIREGTLRESQVAYVASEFENLSLTLLAKHDLVAFNPPQLPVAFTDRKYLQAVECSRIMSQFRLGGPDGLSIVRQFLRWYAALPDWRPRAVFMLSSFLGRYQINDAINQYGLRATTLSETAVPLRECLTEAANRFSHDIDEMRNRSLQLREGTWTKVLLTIQLT
jgi:methylase of polypeptide subunit release factors